MKLKLYIDFDGVILDTIDVSYKLIEDAGIELIDSNYDRIQRFFIELDWDELIKNSKPINNSILELKKIIASNLYDVKILTHVNSKHEIEVKQNFINKNIPELEVIYVNKKDNKCDVVDCKNAILVDDFTENLELWEKKGGIPIKFSTSSKTYDIMYTDNLDFLIENYEQIKNMLKD